jgi:MoaA/NifB/PqqE/SkfB family radical SAM enzyme
MTAANLAAGDHVVLSGGEPTIHDDFLEIVKLLASQRIAITLLSNSEKFADYDFAKRMSNIIDNKTFDVVSAIHSSDQLIHERITGVVGSFQRSCDGIYNLLKLNINVTIKQIINKLTYTGLPEWADYVIENFGPQVQVQFTNMDYCGRAEKNAEQLFVSLADIKPYLEKAIDRFERENFKRRIRIIEAPFCMLDPYYWKYFVETGQSIDMYSAPNVENSSGFTLNLENQCGTWYNECQSCLVRESCPGIWKSAYEFGEGVRPSPISG